MQRFEAPVGLSIARLSAPQPSPFHVARPRLIHLLDDAATLPLTLVTGGPGTGKTNAVTAWIRGGQVPGPVAWVTLDKTLDTPSRLWSAIIAALESSLGELTLGELQPPGTIEPAFIDVLRDRVGGHDVVLVLDDVHELGADALAGLDPSCGSLPQACTPCSSPGTCPSSRSSVTGWPDAWARCAPRTWSSAGRRSATSSRHTA